MEYLIPPFFKNNFKPKVIAIVMAIVVWIFINQSITDSKTITGVPIRVIHIPNDKTIAGLLPTGYLTHRYPLTLSGTRRIVDEIETGDVEVLLDASTFDSDEWPVLITKKNLISLNPDIDLKRHVTYVEHPDIVLRLSHLVTAQIPVELKYPVGQAPEGYEFLDIFPHTIHQTVSGPQEDIELLKQKGLKIAFNLSQLSKEDLDCLNSSHDNEVCFFPPDIWKQIPIPFKRNIQERVNDPKSEQIRIDFLKKTTFALERDIPVQVFYPQKTIETLNPRTHRLQLGKDLYEKNGVVYLKPPLLAKNVSKSFLEFIKDHIQIVLIAAPNDEREELLWSVEPIKPGQIEDAYVAYQMAHMPPDSYTSQSKKEEMMRSRFRDYLKKVTWWISPDRELNLFATLDRHEIVVEVH